MPSKNDKPRTNFKLDNTRLIRGLEMMMVIMVVVMMTIKTIFVITIVCVKIHTHLSKEIGHIILVFI